MVRLKPDTHELTTAIYFSVEHVKLWLVQPAATELQLSDKLKFSTPARVYNKLERDVYITQCVTPGSDAGVRTLSRRR